MRCSAILTLLLCIVAPFAALGFGGGPPQTAPTQPGKKKFGVFSGLDKDGDGHVSGKELLKGTKEYFDTDNDGHVSPSEVIRGLLRKRIYNGLCWFLENEWIGMGTAAVLMYFALVEVMEEGLHGSHTSVLVLALAHFLHYFREFIKPEHGSGHEEQEHLKPHK